jgi:hypothetical protein
MVASGRFLNAEEHEYTINSIPPIVANVPVGTSVTFESDRCCDAAQRTNSVHGGAMKCCEDQDACVYIRSFGMGVKLAGANHARLSRFRCATKANGVGIRLPSSTSENRHHRRLEGDCLRAAEAVCLPNPLRLSATHSKAEEPYLSVNVHGSSNVN